MSSGRGRAPQTYFVSCPAGGEPVLLAEARALRLGRLEGQVGGIRFVGSESDGWRAVLWLRTAVRVYREIARFPAATADELYRGAQFVCWDSVLTADETFAIDARVSNSALTHSGFVALKVKDALVDWFRERHGVRPSVDPSAPQVRLALHLFRNRCTLSLDIAGRSLHRRGYRLAAAPAPLSECLAAVAVGLSGWDRKSPFLDPFCGSGTILIEAGLEAANIAPGLFSEDFAFARRRGFNGDRWLELREQARRAASMPRRLVLRGTDLDPAAVEAARKNIETAGLSELIRVEAGDARLFAPTPGWGATVVSNPPYGIRLGDEADLLPLYEALGRIFKERCRGFHIYLILASGRLAKALALKPTHYWPLKNGGIPCRLVRYEIH